MRRSIRQERADQPKVTRRGALMLGAQLAVVGVLGFRLHQLQVRQFEQFRLQAEENRINIRLIPPQRGLIFDRHGRPIAENKPNFQVVLIREQASDPLAVLNDLAKLLPLSQERIETVLDESRRRSAFVPITVAEHLSWEDYSRIAINTPSLPGIVTEVGLTRHYPLEGVFAHAVGYVGPVSEADIAARETPDPVFEIPAFQIGKTGFERELEEDLRGRAGTSHIEVNAAGRLIREIDRQEGLAGVDYHLSLDADIQNYALQRMRGESASTVMLEVNSGDVVVMASSPSFDPNSFVLGIGNEEWNGLLNNEYLPLSNKTVSGAYPPGSTFKLAVLMAALEEGVLKPNETVYCPGHYQLGNQRFHCWKRGGHGRVDMIESLKYSCDVFYYEVSQRVGIEKIGEIANRLGLGMAPDLPLSAISRGLIPTKEWKLRNYDQPWRLGDTLNAAIGQGFTLATPMQLAIMTARVASGKMVEPKLVYSRSGLPPEREDAPPLSVAQSSLDAVRRGMFEVSNVQRGTAFNSRIAEMDMALAGKTGTSQVRRITLEEREAGITENEDLPWNRRDHALFVAFAPYENPRYAISVVVEHGGSGSQAAAPIARDIMIRALYGSEPPITAWPSHLRRQVQDELQTNPIIELGPIRSGNGSA